MTGRERWARAATAADAHTTRCPVCSVPAGYWPGSRRLFCPEGRALREAAREAAMAFPVPR